jgi:hypothetical protein
MRNRRAAVVIAGVIALMMLASPALAHYVYEIRITRQWDNYCLEQRSETSHGDNMGGYSGADTWSYQKAPVPLPGQNCEASLMGGVDRKIGVKIHYYMHFSGGWGLCRTTRWNRLYGQHISMGRHWSRPCGHGYYDTKGFAELYYNGNWIKAHLWSGSHYL